MLKDISFPISRRYKSRSENEPIGFFSDCLCNATQFDLMLGFFSSSAISVLSDGFAVFLYNGGCMRLIINDVLTEQDRNAIVQGSSTEDIPYFDIKNVELIKHTLSERNVHFFECLAWLIRNDKLDIKIVVPKEGLGIAHTKSGIFSDGINVVGFDGSCNFSRTALIDNIESITAFCDWDSQISVATINGLKEDFINVFAGKDDSVEYVSPDNVKVRIAKSFKDKELITLLEDEYKLLQQKGAQKLSSSVRKALEKAKNKVEVTIEKMKQEETSNVTEFAEPKFPYESGPREYQRKAFEKWKNNNQKGLFAMATGTGKTITSLNCLLEIYKKKGYYKALILVPTIALVEQWEKECRKFNFNSIVKVCSKYNSWMSSVANIRMLEMTNTNGELSYIIISTYSSFARSNVFAELNQFSHKQLLLIADEAHNMGGDLMSLKMENIKYLRRIGLSATPERQFDEAGNQQIMKFFGCNDDYTFEYSMRDAIANGALCKYYYYPHIVKLTDDEMYDYIEISKKIVKLINKEDADSQEILTRLLLKRKRIIHKAYNKQRIFRDILENRIKEKGSLKYSLIYVPEGNKPDDANADIFDLRDTMGDDEDSSHLIDLYTSIVRDIDNHVTVRKFTSESKDREAMLQGFAKGEIDVLTSMKCLDEGVDVPRSEFAIFCASTGNPRQFIQRRGRVLRTHPDKKNAIIHDMIVIPQVGYNEENYNFERNLIIAELRRVNDFALLSENANDSLKALDAVLNQYSISLFNV